MSCMVRIGGYSCRRRRMRRVTMPPISARPAMPAAVIISTYGVVWLDSSPVGVGDWGTVVQEIDSTQICASVGPKQRSRLLLLLCD